MNRKYAFHPGTYELGENEKFYSGQEARGWRLVKRGAYLSRFARVEPSRARYRVEVCPSLFLEGGALPEEQVAVFEDCGWEYVAGRGGLHVFRTPEGSAAPEFYNDPVQQAAALRKVRRDLWVGAAAVPAAFVGAWAFFSLTTGVAGDRFRAQFIRGVVESPGVFLCYGFWLLAALWQCLRGAWAVSGVYRRLRRGLPMDHAPRRSFRLVGPALLGLGLAGLLLAAGQVLARQAGPLPAQPEGPYLRLEELGWEGEPGRLINQDPGIERTWSPLADRWETLEVLDLPGGGRVWLRQEVYRLRCGGLADELAWALREDAPLARDGGSFREIEAPGLDGAWTSGGLELVAVRGNLAALVTFLDSAGGQELDAPSICRALAERWGDGSFSN